MQGSADGTSGTNGTSDTNGHDHSKHGDRNPEFLALPESVDIQDQIDACRSDLTYLHVAQGIVTKLERKAENAADLDELRFLRDCLNGGHGKTDVPLFNNKQIRLSRERKKTQREGFEQRGALYRTRNQSRGDATPTTPIDRTSGMPFMGPVLPQWPVSDLPDGVAAKLTEVFDASFNGWDFDVFRLTALTSGRPLQFAGWEALTRCGSFSEFLLSPEKTQAFLREAESMYKSSSAVPYHNSVHAADVTQTLWSLLQAFGFAEFFDAMDCFTSVFAATIHDVGHDGRNNSFHVSVRDHLALTYNDRSVLENFHVSYAFRELLRPGLATNMLEGLSREQFDIVRREVVDMVLKTDVAVHNQVIREFDSLVIRFGRGTEDWQTDQNAMYTLRATALHAADVSNTAKTFELSIQWTRRLLQEFFGQGDEERDLGLPVSPLCDRYNLDVPASQTGFIDLVAIPLFHQLATFAPKIDTVCLAILSVNMATWEARSKNEVQDEDFEALKKAAPVPPTLDGLAAEDQPGQADGEETRDKLLAEFPENTTAATCWCFPRTHPHKFC